jgi:hypothetical protein
MGTANDRLERYSILAGILATLLWVVGVAMSRGQHVGLPGGLPEEGAGDVLTYFRENEGSVLAGSWLFMLGSLAFLWFVGALRSRLTRTEDGAGTFATIALGGGIATAVFTLGMPIGGLVATLGVTEIEASTAQALNGVEAVFFIGAELSAIVLLTATAAAWLQTRTVATWWAWATILLAVWLVILPIGWIGLLIGLPVWTIVTSAILLRRPATERLAPAQHA